MFPTIEILNQQFFVVGLGLICCLFVFLTVIKYYTTKYNLKFSKFLASLWYFLVLPYLGGRYVATMVDTRMIAPFFPLPDPSLLSPDQTVWGEVIDRTINWILAVIAPFNYNFHIVGVMAGLFVAFWFFRRSSHSLLEERKRIDTLTYAIALSSVLAGVFFVFGDTWVGKPTDLAIGIVGLSETSALSEYGNKVYPIGIFLSILSIVVYVVTVTIQNVRKVYGMGIIGMIIFIIGLNILHFFMDYPRIGFVQIGEWTAGIPLADGQIYAFDLLNYASVVFIGVLLWHWRFLGDGWASATKQKTKKTRDPHADTLVGRQMTASPASETDGSSAGPSASPETESTDSTDAETPDDVPKPT